MAAGTGPFAFAEFHLLGGLEVLVNGTAVALGGPKPRALLTRLLLSPNEVVAVDTLIDDLWQDAPPAGAANTLQAYLSRLRKTLGSARIERTGPGYRLNVAPGELDVERFEHLLRAGIEANRRRESHVAGGLLGEALAVFRGPALADTRFENFARATAERLDAARVLALEERVDADLDLGRHRDLIGELEALVAEFPLRERLTAQLMLALYRSGRQGDALRAYQRLRTQLIEELGLEPSAELQQLELAILEQSAELAWVGDAPAASPEPPSNLPEHNTPLVGIDLALVALDDLLGVGRFVTITGPGGVGKTRVATELARRVRPRYAGGVWLADLSAASGSADVVAAVAAATGAAGTTVDAVAEHLGAQRVVLVLDNCDHVIDATAALADELLAACDGLVTVATSRRPVGAAQERVYPLAPLSLESAIELFHLRAGTDEPGVAELCRLLDGLPLAIELAAARAVLVTVTDLHRRLGGSIAALRDAEPAGGRHDSLEATLAWSHDVLAREDRAVLRRLAAFRGGFELDGAEAVCPALDPADVLDVLGRLVRASFVSVARTNGRPRHRVLEPIVEFVLSQAADDDAAMLHAMYMTALAASLSDDFRQGGGQQGVLERTRLEDGNFRVALTWLARVASQRDTLRALASSLAPLWEATGTSRDLRRWLELGTHGVRADEPGMAEAQTWAARFARQDGDLDEAATAGTNAVDAARATADDRVLSRALTEQSENARQRFDFVRAMEFANDALAAARRAGDLPAEQSALGNLGGLAFVRGDARDAARWWEDALALARTRRDDHGTAVFLGNLGAAADRLGEHERSIDLTENSLAICRRIGDEPGVSAALNNLAATWALVGDFDRARGAAEECVLRAAEGRERVAQGRAMWALGKISLRSGDFDRARAELVDAHAVMEATDDVQGALGCLLALGQAACGQGDLRQARWYLESLLRRAIELDATPMIAPALSDLGDLDLREGNPAAAWVRLNEALSRFRALGQDHDVAEVERRLAALAASP